MTAEKSEFGELARWEKCATLVGDFEWQRDASPGSEYSHIRSVTWAEYPVRFMMNEFGSVEDRRTRKIANRAFEVAMLSATASDLGRRLYKRYFIYPNDAIALLDATVGDPDDPRTESELRQSFNFTLDNHLYIPNEEDLLVLDNSLELGYQDGVQLYKRE